jgi:hypothetical protein
MTHGVTIEGQFSIRVFARVGGLWVEIINKISTSHFLVMEGNYKYQLKSAIKNLKSNKDPWKNNRSVFWTFSLCIVRKILINSKDRRGFEMIYS